ncbi:aminotransferase class IV family protein [Microbacterium amylolyticum]|uniref:Branched-subunit amino acid aminotransferase/4-amino-4-deoxychorismate lyase n=1 Tax=Microbacterium amylolyticum TaxID=936337 RepID=A0ABS4ZGF0_9MICO|nr:aminotransferase class IV family protein [Microbacterium amylolyticum]MBP2436361.1 branched-subunit amino acid aminotransferase/4-amino-4-deoxychorismate lyase [Microbacterium amylolyticum]
MQQLDGAPVTAQDLQPLAMLGFAHFTTVRVDDGLVRGLAMHLERLVRDARTLFDVDLDADLVRERIRAAIADESSSVTVRITLFDPALRLERPGADASPSILVTPRPASDDELPPITLQSVRFGRDTPELKHTGLFGALYRRRLAQRAGFDDALFVDGGGRISEGPTWNIGFVQGDRVIWADGDALPGVTRDLLDSVAGETSAEYVSLERLGSMDAAFATSSGVGVRPITAVDDVSWPTDHPALDRLRHAYRGISGEPL